MIKYFCDACGNEVKESANRTMLVVEQANNNWPKVKISVDVIVSIDNTANAGVVCLPCVQRVVSEGLPSRRTTR